MSQFCFFLISVSFFSNHLSVKAGPPESAHMYRTWLLLWLGHISQDLHLQVVQPSRIHALSDCAIRGAGGQGSAPAPLCGPNPNPHSTRLGEDSAQGDDGHGKSQQPGNYPLKSYFEI